MRARANPAALADLDPRSCCFYENAGSINGMTPNARHSSHPTVVEYAVQEMFKGKSPKVAAANAAARLNGGINMFIDTKNDVEIDPAELEEALWMNMAKYATKYPIKPGEERNVARGTLAHFQQWKWGKPPKTKMEDMLMERMLDLQEQVRLSNEIIDEVIEEEGVLHENPTKLPPGVIEDQPPDEESIFGSRLGTRSRVTWPWLKSKFGKQPPREEVSDRDYWNGSWGKLTIEVRPFDANGKWLEHLNQEFTPDSLRAARQYGFDLMRDLSEVDGFWCEARLDKYWTDRGTRESMRMMILGRYERAPQSAHAPNGRLVLIDPVEDETNTRALSSVKLRAARGGDFASAMIAAGNFAKKAGVSCYVYGGNSFGHAVYRVATKKSDALNPINNTGPTVWEVTPALNVVRWSAVRSEGDLVTNSSHYVWVIGHNGAPIDGEGPYGPMDLSRAESFARIGATEGSHDRAVSIGVDVMASSFKIIRRYRRGTGERVL